MEREQPQQPEVEVLGRVIYLSAEQIALAALVDQMDDRIFRPWEETKSV